MARPPALIALPALRAQDASVLTLERALVERVLDGEANAYRHLIERHQRRVFSIVVRMIGNDSDAEDLTQQAFLSAYEALARFDTAQPFSAWINRIAINLAKDHLKSRKRTEVSLPDGLAATAAWLSSASPDQETETDAARQRMVLARALDALSPKDREVLILKDVEELSYKEMRELLGWPITALKIRVIRARHRLRKVLEKWGHHG